MARREVVGCLELAAWGLLRVAEEREAAEGREEREAAVAAAVLAVALEVPPVMAQTPVFVARMGRYYSPVQKQIYAPLPKPALPTVPRALAIWRRPSMAFLWALVTRAKPTRIAPPLCGAWTIPWFRAPEPPRV